MPRKYLMVLALSFLFVFPSINCVIAASSQKEEEIYVANFDYTPSTQATPGSAGVTFTVGNIRYQASAKDTKPWFMYPQFKNLDKAVRESLNKLLMAKGFSVSGPFDSYDLIPYSDKKAIDLYLAPTIEVSVISPREVYSIEDIKLEVAGKIILEQREIVTRELMWAKSIPFKKFGFPFVLGIITWERLANTRDAYNKKIKKTIASVELSTANMNDLAKEIEKQYPGLMATIYKLIDPEEMRIIKKQCQELKSKRGY